ncbi:MAG: RHS repeat-associated core domain-containing protein [Bacteroidales bacterium]
MAMINAPGAMDNAMGFSYFGARYYDSDLSVWLSVDPMSDEYPHQSPYMYCSGNPVMKVDPNGMNDGWVEGLDGDIYWDKNINTPQQADAAGVEYVGQTITAVNNDGMTIYGDDKGNLHNTVMMKPFDVIGTRENEANSPSLRDDVSLGIGLETTMASEAASGTKTGLIKTIGKTANVVGGVWGAVDNSIAAADAFEKGNNAEGVYQTTQAAAYTVGTVMLFTPAAPIGAAIILVNGLVDIGEYFYKNW